MLKMVIKKEWSKNKQSNTYIKNVKKSADSNVLQQS